MESERLATSNCEWVALLDEGTSARPHAASIGWEVEWALRLVDDIDRWMLVMDSKM